MLFSVPKGVRHLGAKTTQDTLYEIRKFLAGIVGLGIIKQKFKIAMGVKSGMSGFAFIW